MTTEKKMTEAIEILKQIPFAEIQRAGTTFKSMIITHRLTTLVSCMKTATFGKIDHRLQQFTGTLMSNS